MANKGKPVLFGKLFHLADNNGVFTGSMKPGQVGIVNDTYTCSIIPKGQRFMKKALHFEAIERAVEFQITNL